MSAHPNAENEIDQFNNWLPEMRKILDEKFDWNVLLQMCCTTTNQSFILFKRGLSPDEAAQWYYDYETKTDPRHK